MDDFYIEYLFIQIIKIFVVRNKEFINAQLKMLQKNAEKFAIFLEYVNPQCFCFSLRATRMFSLINVLVYSRIILPGHFI